VNLSSGQKQFFKPVNYVARQQKITVQFTKHKTDTEGNIYFMGTNDVKSTVPSYKIQATVSLAHTDKKIQILKQSLVENTLQYQDQF